jgi:hypothetical protein
MAKALKERTYANLGDALPQKLTNLHYRRVYKDELENNIEIFPYNVFDNFDVMRG